MRKVFDKKFLVTFAAGFALILLTLYFYQIRKFYHDSLGYWDLAAFFSENGFGIHDFPEGRIKELTAIRGYVFPVILAICGGGGQKPDGLYWVGVSAAYAFAFAYVVPALLKQLTGKIQTVPERLSILILTLLFFPDLFCYPLTDLPTVLFYFAVLLLLFKIREQKEGNFYLLLYAFCYGMLNYIVYNIRPNYMFNLYLSVIVLIFISRKVKIRYRIAMAVFAILGAALPALPQCIINYGNYGVFSWENPLGLYASNRISFLLFEGMQYPRIDTVVVPGIDTSNIFCLDPVFASIIQNEGLVNSPETFGILTYIGLFFKYPLEFFGLVATHLANFMDLRYNASYVTGLRYNFVKAVGNIIVIYYTWLVIKIRLQRDSLSKKKSPEWSNFLELMKKYGLFVFLTVLPAVSSIPGHVEVRYVLAIYFVIYIIISNSIKDYKMTGNYIKTNIISVVTGLLILLGTYAAITNWTLANSNLGNMIFGG